MSWAQPSRGSAESGEPMAASLRLGCVSYLNARPLIEGLEGSGLDVRFDVPGRLLADLESGAVDVALCPVIDYFRASEPLAIVPAGGIGCLGPTLTVRLFSQVPLDRLTVVHGDSDSHTSVALLRVVLSALYGREVEVVAYEARERTAGGKLIELPEAMLLIGDKVVTAAPDGQRYRYTLDLGEAWHELTGLPFVFATWLARPGVRLGAWPARLASQRRWNERRLGEIADRHGPPRGWPGELARRYLTQILRFGLGKDELDAIERFAALAHAHGLIEQPGPLRLHGDGPTVAGLGEAGFERR